MLIKKSACFQYSLYVGMEVNLEYRQTEWTNLRWDMTILVKLRSMSLKRIMRKVGADIKEVVLREV